MRTNLLKTMLVAVGLAASVGAWADNISTLPVTEDFESGTGIFTGGEVNSSNTNIGSVLLVNNTTATATFDTNADEEGNQAYTLAENEVVTFTYTAYHGYLGGNKTTTVSFNNSDGVALASYVYSQTGCNITDVSVGGTTVSDFSAFGFQSYYNARKSANGISGNGYAYQNDTKSNPQITISIAQNGYVTLSFVLENKSINQTYSATLPESVKKDLATITIKFNGNNSDRGYAIDNLSITTETVETKMASYTINYQLDGTTVSTKTGTSLEGTTIEAEKIVYSDDEQKYFATDETLPSITLSANDDNMLNVAVRKAYSATLDLTTTVNGTSSNKSYTFIEADDNSTTWTYAYSLYAKGEDGLYYKADQTDENKFGETGTYSDGDKFEKSVTYTTADNSIVFFSEGESAEGTNISYSNGATGYVAAQNYTNRGISVGTLPAGTYEFTANITANANRQLTLRDASSADEDTNIKAQLTEAGIKTTTFTLTAPTALVICGRTATGGVKANQSADFDYVYIKNVASQTISITSAGYATAVTSYNVTIPENVKAYAVTVNDDATAATLNELSGVIAAGTAILVKGDEGSYEFPVSTDEATTIEKNDLVAATADVTADGTQYALAKKTDGVGFYKVKEGVSIPAGKAYLVVKSAEAKAFYGFGGETTGINSLNAAATVGDAKVYNLNGQLVGKSLQGVKKGVYIVNGKKTVKN